MAVRCAVLAVALLGTAAAAAEPSLLDAAEAGDHEAALAALQAGGDVQARAPDGTLVDPFGGIRDLDARSVFAVGTVHCVGVDALREVRTDRARGGLLRVRRPHQFPVLCDRAFAFEHLDHDRSGHHEIDQVLEERSLTMHGVEPLRLGARQVLKWIHQRGEGEFAQMSDLARDLRVKLSTQATIAAPPSTMAERWRCARNFSRHRRTRTWPRRWFGMVLHCAAVVTRPQV